LTLGRSRYQLFKLPVTFIYRVTDTRSFLGAPFFYSEGVLRGDQILHPNRAQIPYLYIFSFLRLIICA